MCDGRTVSKQCILPSSRFSKRGIRTAALQSVTGLVARLLLYAMESFLTKLPPKLDGVVRLEADACGQHWTFCCDCAWPTFWEAQTKASISASIPFGL